MSRGPSETAEGLVLRARGIEKTFVDGDVETHVLHGIDLDLERGSFVALMGPSGSGKSTLLSILGTLLQPSAGRIEIDQQNVLELSEKRLTEFRNRSLGFVFQYHHLLPDFTALENVVFPSYVIHGRETPAARQRGRELLDRVGLSERATYRSTKLSGGQKQRVAIARALMNRPPLILADEPTGNLDRETTWQIVALLQEIASEERTTFLVSTHDPEIAARCDRTVQVVDGLIDEGLVG
ncbi:MAG: ABC transporter ATP-binding protein [Acidobacteriota bacterium]